MVSIGLQLVGAMTVTMVILYLALRASMAVRHRLMVWRLKRQYETAYEREQRQIERRVRWKHRLRLPDLPAIGPMRDASIEEEEAVRRARAYYG